MESLKAIPFLYQAKAKFALLAFDSYVSLAQHTAIFFVYCLWFLSTVGTVAALLCLRFGASSVLLRFGGRPRGPGLFVKINDFAS